MCALAGRHRGALPRSLAQAQLFISFLKQRAGRLSSACPPSGVSSPHVALLEGWEVPEVGSGGTKGFVSGLVCGFLQPGPWGREKRSPRGRMGVRMGRIGLAKHP